MQILKENVYPYSLDLKILYFHILQMHHHIEWLKIPKNDTTQAPSAALSHLQGMPLPMLKYDYTIKYEPCKEMILADR